MIKAALHKRLRATQGIMNLEVDISIAKGSFNALFGPSGVGKTSCLRMLCGLMKPDSGIIKKDEIAWFNAQKRMNLKPGQRNIGYVFQDLALFPNMTVEENILYASGGNDTELIHELLKITDLEGLKDQLPNMLSGGQQRRVALIRAIAQKPDLLLLDEPFSGLDQSIRLKLQDNLELLHDRFGFSVILVSHDLAEVCKLADNVWLMEDGKIIKRGSPSEVFGLEAAADQLKLVGKAVQILEEHLVVSFNGSTFKMKRTPELNSVEIGQWVQLKIDPQSGQLNTIDLKQ